MPSNTICDLVILLGLKKSEINAVRWDFLFLFLLEKDIFERPYIKNMKVL
jgi:hypothetical protein